MKNFYDFCHLLHEANAPQGPNPAAMPQTQNGLVGNAAAAPAPEPVDPTQKEEDKLLALIAAKTRQPALKYRPLAKIINRAKLNALFDELINAIGNMTTSQFATVDKRHSAMFPGQQPPVG